MNNSIILRTTEVGRSDEQYSDFRRKCEPQWEIKMEIEIIKDLAAEKGFTLTDLVKYAINKVIEE